MTYGNNEVNVRCDLCNRFLLDGAKDVRELDKPYELPYEIKWEGTNCTITNKVVRHICADCLANVMDAVKNCME